VVEHLAEAICHAAFDAAGHVLQQVSILGAGPQAARR
jgi:hypothetical protein